jgi:transcriptional regulator with AAA-type ATPase domain
VLDATEATSQDWLVQARHALLDGEGDLVIRHIDRLTARQAHFLASVLQEMRAAEQPETRRVAVTRTPGTGAPANLAELLRSFPRSVALPPLRHHVEDLPELVRFFMGKLSPHGRLTCSPEAMQLLARSTWPGNVEQLWQVMRGIVARKRVGSIEPGDQPPPAQPAGGAGARRDRAEPAGLGR